MESQVAGKIGERPVTRWRRDYDDVSSDSSKIQGPSTSGTAAQIKFERPRSRRGNKDESSDTYVSGSNRSATPGRHALARPPSASILSNRPIASSRLNTISSSGFGRLNTGLSTPGQVNMSVLERPITQHGIAGIRPGTTRGLTMTRQIQDRRYYVGLLQLKIRELTQEVAVIMKDIDNHNKERATFLHYDKRAKDLAAELTSLQAELADYNIVVDKMTSDLDKEYIEREAEDLALKNERSLIEIEKMFEERKELERRLDKMEKQLENEKKRTERLVESMDSSTREKYDELLKEKAELQEKANKLQQELDELSKEQASLEEEIAFSPLKQEALKLHVKIIEAEEQRDKLREAERNRLSPEEEKEKLLQKIKQDNTDIAAAEAQLAEKKKRIEEAEHELEQLETDIEDTQTEKQIKYKELRKREEVMENFMSSFEQHREDETKKLEKLEKNIVQHLEAISSTLDADTDFGISEEMAILNNISSHNDYEYTNHDDSFEGLSKEHFRLQRVLRNMAMMEQKLKTETAELNEKINNRESKLISLEDLDNLKANSEKKQEALTIERDDLRKQRSMYEEELQAIQDEYDEIKQRLTANETFVQISTLESQLDKLKEEHTKIKDFIVEQKENGNYDSLKERAFNLANEHGIMLKDSLKCIY